MKKQVTENLIKKFARRMIAEGEMETATASLAAKDLVDRLQDIVSEIGKMVNDELPSLIDSIRSSFGTEQADGYQQVANSVLAELLDIVKEKKSTLENATLVLTGDASPEGGGSDLNLPDDGEEAPEGDLDLDMGTGPDGGEDKMAVKNPLGRETRFPAEESRRFNKALSEAKIFALDKALKETNTKKFPIRAKRLAEELRRIVTIAIKEEAKKKVGHAEWRKPKCECGHPRGIHVVGSGCADKTGGKKCSCKKFDMAKKAVKEGKKPAFLKKEENVDKSSKKMMKPVKKVSESNVVGSAVKSFTNGVAGKPSSLQNTKFYGSNPGNSPEDTEDTISNYHDENGKVVSKEYFYSTVMPRFRKASGTWNESTSKKMMKPVKKVTESDAASKPKFGIVKKAAKKAGVPVKNAKLAKDKK